MADLSDFKGLNPAWCPGCGDFGILQALKKALVALGREPRDVVLVSGIGQAAKMPHYLRANVFNGLHGRGLPAATGVKLANHGLTVVACGGDGDMYGEGGNHLIHAIRRNPDLTLLVHDNKIYGLTKGQASPTTDQGVKTNVQVQGVANQPLNPLALAISQKCGFVARGFSGDIPYLSEIIRKGITYRGFAMIEIMQPCVSFNKINTAAWYKERIYKLEDESGYDPSDMHQALDKAYEWGERIPTGILFIHHKPTYEDKIFSPEATPLISKNIDPKQVFPLLRLYS